MRNAKAMNFLGLDLNYRRRFCDPAKYDFARMIDEPRPTGVRAIDAASSVDHVSPLRDTLCGRAESEVVLLPRSVPVHGIRTVDLPREPARYRSVSACPALQALSPRDSCDGGPQYPGQCERGARLAHPCRLRAEPDRHRTAAVCRRGLRCRSEGIGLRAGHDHHRSVPVGVFVGAL